MKYWVVLIFFLVSVPLVAANPTYRPKAYVHARVSSLEWVADDDFSDELIENIHNFNLSRYSYIWINVTLEFWNPSVVPVTVYDFLDEDIDASNFLMVKADHNVSIAMPRDLGCFWLTDGSLKTGDDADCRAYVESYFDTQVIPRGVHAFVVDTVVRLNQSGVDDWIPGTYQVYPAGLSTVPYFVVKNETGVFDFPGDLPEGWGSMRGLGYGVSLANLPISSLLILYGTPLVLLVSAVILYRRKRH